MTTSQHTGQAQDVETLDILDTEQEAQAEDIVRDWELDDAGLAKSAGTILAFVRSYSEQRGKRTLQEWLQLQFEGYPALWTQGATAVAAADEVVAAVVRANAAKESLQTHLDQGRSQTNWIAERIEQAAAAAASRDVGAYAATIESAIEQANQDSWRVLARQDGTISQCYNLDGFIAEQHHVSSFNIDAAAKGSAYRARVLTPEPGATYGKNSMDIGVYDGNGKLVRRYQVKYGADADATSTLFEKGDYRGQRKLVPAGHVDGVDGSTERIEIDGVESTPLSKEEAKARQRQAQQELEAKQYEWNEANRGAIARRLGKQALVGACITAGFQGVRILGRRAWNALIGKTNPPANEDLREFFECSLSSCKHVGIQVAVSGGLVVAVKSGWLGKVLKGTPAGRLADMACLGLQSAKVLYKFGKGELTGAEAVNAMGESTISCALSLTAASQGVSIGVAIGSVLGPLGAAAGGLVGGIAAGIAGNAVAGPLYEASKSIARRAIDTAREGMARIGEGMAQAHRALSDTVSNMFAAVFG